jgi:hypothetical protein
VIWQAAELERTVKLARGAVAPGDAPFSRQAFERLLWSDHPALYDALALCAPGARETPPRRQGAALLDWARAGLREGRSLVASGLERLVPELACWAWQQGRALEATLDVGAVLTPPHAAAFAPHADADDVLVLQLEGRKHWQWARGEAGPRPQHHRELAEAAFTAAAPHEAVLAPGDLLFLPGGLPHRAFTAHAATLQLTVTLQPYRWLDLLADLADIAAEDEPALRGRADAAGAPRALPSDLAALAARAAHEPALLGRALAHRRRREIAASRTLPLGVLLPEGPAWCAAQPVVRRGGLTCELRPLLAGACLDYAGPVSGALHAPDFAAPALAFVATREGPFLADELPDVLAPDEKCALVERLLADGCLEVVA